jgi:hypothetical protein
MVKSKVMEERMTEAKRDAPFYTGVKMHIDKRSGYSLWVPSDWHKLPVRPNFHGMMFSPYPDDINTCLLSEKRRLKYSVKTDEMPVLMEGFVQGINALPDVKIESQEQTFSESINIFDARFSFLEGENRRKRWVRNIYWGNGQLILIAQGRTVEDFEYWLPMFFNSITTCTVI